MTPGAQPNEGSTTPIRAAVSLLWGCPWMTVMPDPSKKRTDTIHGTGPHLWDRSPSCPRDLCQAAQGVQHAGSNQGVLSTKPWGSCQWDAMLCVMSAFP